MRCISRVLVSTCAVAGVALLSTTVARAADVPGNKSTRATIKQGAKYTFGLVDYAGDADWYKVSLTKGRNYAFQLDFSDPFVIVNGDECGVTFILALIDPKGKVAAKSQAVSCDQDGGFELRPKSGGTFFVSVSGPARGGYKVRAAADAAPDRSTDATLTVGKPLNGSLLFGRDRDYYRVRLVAGTGYTLALEETGRCDAPFAEVATAAGQILAKGGPAANPSFTAPRTADYFVHVFDFNNEFECSYRIAVN